jgi:fucose permease
VARGREIAVVYAAGVVQGVALVTFPAASAIFTSPAHYGLSSEAYGGLFLPQALAAIGASLLGAGLGRRLGTRRLYLLGLGANLLAMALLVASRFVAAHALAYGILLVATASLGAGFGLTVPALNTLAAVFFPRTIDSAVLVLNALLGLGTALAPLFVALFVDLGAWWGLPVLVAVLLLALLALSADLRLDIGAAAPGPADPALPARFWLFAAFALLYGIVETMNGNWATLYMTRTQGAGPALASLALTMFWATVTAGRVLFAAVERWLPPRVVYRGLPLVSAAVLLVTAALPKGEPWLGVLAFSLAGLGCSALLPLTISFGQSAMSSAAPSVAGGLIAAYQVGYGLAAFGVGPLLERTGHDLGAAFAGTTVVALAMATVSALAVRHRSALKEESP